MVPTIVGKNTRANDYGTPNITLNSNKDLAIDEDPVVPVVTSGLGTDVNPVVVS